MYWEYTGSENTEQTIVLALKRGMELGIEEYVVASNTGETVFKMLEMIGHETIVPKIICVTHQVGFKNPGEDEISAKVRKQLVEKGVHVLTTTHLFAGVDRALRYQFGGVYPAEVVAMSLRMLGQGVKVGVEIAIMALDAGLIPYDKEVIAIGGTGSGADTAIVIKPDHSSSIFKSEIKEIICKPR